jgi:hypothetical protein
MVSGVLEFVSMTLLPKQIRNNKEWGVPGKGTHFLDPSYKSEQGQQSGL